MNREVFIETNNVSNFRQAAHRLASRHRLQPGFLVIEGKSGRGKSFAAHNWFSVHGGVYFRAWEGMSQHAFLQELSFEVTAVRPHGSHNCKRAIIDKLRVSPHPVIVDEADRLALGRLEDLRDINEASDAAMILIGEVGLLGRLAAKDRIYSRVAEVVNFEPINKSDITLYAAQMADLKLDADAAAQLATKSEGSFRMIHNYIIQIAEFAEANGLVEIGADNLKLIDLRQLQ
jgi:DNA transposition AAA+ family ATPase